MTTEKSISFIGTVEETSTSLVTVQSGYKIDPQLDQWVLDKDSRINLDFLESVDDVSAGFIRATLLERAKIYMPGSIEGDCVALRDFLRTADSLDSKYFFKWVPLAKSSEYPLIVKSFLLFGCKVGIPGINMELIDTLKEHTLSANRRVALKPVETHNLIEGPFSDLELENIMAKSLQSYTEGKMPLMQYAALMFFAQTGRRGIQASDLKLKDLQESRTNDGNRVYYINVPRRKQRGQKFRETFNKTVIDQDLWIVLQLHSAQVKQNIMDNIKGVDESVFGELPLFPSKELSRIDSIKLLMEKVMGDYFHIRAAYLSQLISNTSELLGITSERTGAHLIITAKRFRHTIGTNSAREGYGARVIAEILDHTTDVVAGIYSKNTPDIVERLDRALAIQLAPLAQTFAGVIVKHEQDAVRGNDPNSRVSNGRESLGSCGSFSFCSASAPIACYTCRHFQPWIDAPHEEVLTHLLEERERVKDVTGDTRIAAVNDRLILAVTEVIQRCEDSSND